MFFILLSKNYKSEFLFLSMTSAPTVPKFPAVSLATLTACAANVPQKETSARVHSESIASSFAAQAAPTETAEAAETEQNPAEMYWLALDAFIPLGKDLTHNMKYIAIDMSNLNVLSVEDRAEILNYFIRMVNGR